MTTGSHVPYLPRLIIMNANPTTATIINVLELIPPNVPLPNGLVNVPVAPAPPCSQTAAPVALSLTWTRMYSVSVPMMVDVLKPPLLRKITMPFQRNHDFRRYGSPCGRNDRPGV